MKNHNVFCILTFANQKFFPVVWQMAKSVRRFASYRLHVYDLGLNTDSQKRLTNSGVTVLRTEMPAGVLDREHQRVSSNAHKIYCIEDFIRTRNEPVLVLDADTLVIENIDELWPDQPDGIVVTARHPRDQGAQHLIVRGKFINAGVMAYGPGVPTEFFRQWKERCLQDMNGSDQRPLNDLLAEENIDFAKFDVGQPCKWGNVVVRDGEIYNDTTCRKNCGQYKWRSYLSQNLSRKTLPTWAVSI